MSVLLTSCGLLPSSRVRLQKMSSPSVISRCRSLSTATACCGETRLETGVRMFAPSASPGHASSSASSASSSSFWM
jgi:hypothetical protein